MLLYGQKKDQRTLRRALRDKGGGDSGSHSPVDFMAESGAAALGASFSVTFMAEPGVALRSINLRHFAQGCGVGEPQSLLMTPESSVWRYAVPHVQALGL